MNTSKWAALGAALTICLAVPMAAQAKGLLIINTGDEMFEVDDIPKELADGRASASKFCRLQ